MCGIFGYQGKETHAQNILLNGLKRLEYRGYDSAGLLVGNQKEIKLVKAIGKVSNLSEKVQKEINAEEQFSFGIAHTRRATHGGITENNTHPHYDNKQQFYLVHNGIIENYHKLKQELIAKGYEFYGQTDSEVIANLLTEHRNGNFLETVEKILQIIKGAYALLIVSPLAPGEMIAAKIGSPLLFGHDKDNNFFLSSDKQGLIGYVDQLTYLEDGDLLHIKNNEYTVTSKGIPTQKPFEEMDIKEIESSKGNYKHFMLKEIFEQANIIRRIFKGRVDFQNKILNAEAFHGMQNENFEHIVFIGCGTSYNAGSLGKLWMENLAGIPASCEIASEYEYRNINVNSKTLYVFISQSGETADSIEVLKMIKEKGGHTFGIVNVVGSTISRLTDYGLFTRAGAEIGVASTKAFTAQLSCILLLALFLGKKRALPKAKYEQILRELAKVPTMIEDLLADQTQIRELAQELKKYNNFFFLGRHYQFPIANESSLKLKEITYLHSESYPSGELKHGPLALIDEKIPSVIFCPQDFLFEKNLSSIQEIKARNGKVIAVSDKEIEGSDYTIKIPKTIDDIYPFITVIVGQLLAYHTADILGKNIDKPRNLAKSVTVK
ncbi:MAG: glutamine--fructose-6-phosphate transaminase (isomerizing) [Candidatus Absconditabacteria bacterium]|nr:glutamine--fructose-6-phosphate transaminase (isomerizing) [Candidatus Absconditabacteria bacterium]